MLPTCLCATPTPSGAAGRRPTLPGKGDYRSGRAPLALRRRGSAAGAAAGARGPPPAPGPAGPRGRRARPTGGAATARPAPAAHVAWAPPALTPDPPPPPPGRPERGLSLPPLGPGQTTGLTHAPPTPRPGAPAVAPRLGALWPRQVRAGASARRCPGACSPTAAAVERQPAIWSALPGGAASPPQGCPCRGRAGTRAALRWCLCSRRSRSAHTSLPGRGFGLPPAPQEGTPLPSIPASPRGDRSLPAHRGASAARGAAQPRAPARCRASDLPSQLLTWHRSVSSAEPFPPEMGGPGLPLSLCCSTWSCRGWHKVQLVARAVRTRLAVLPRRCLAYLLPLLSSGMV